MSVETYAPLTVTFSDDPAPLTVKSSLALVPGDVQASVIVPRLISLVVPRL
jgi:hypothetical protein